MELGVEWATRMAAGIGRHVAKFRGARGMTAQALSDRCSEIGYRIDRSVIAKLETGRRQNVTVAEVLVLADALDVPVLLLMLPLGDEADIEFLPGRVLPVPDVLDQLSGDPSGGGGEWRKAATVIGMYRMHADLVREWQAESVELVRWRSATGPPGDEWIPEKQTEMYDLARQRTWTHLLALRATLERDGLLLPVLPADLAAREEAQR